MRECKHCGDPFEPEIKGQVFCSERCAESYARVMLKLNNRRRYVLRKAVSVSASVGVVKTTGFAFEAILKKKGRFVIANESLKEIYDNNKIKASFDTLLAQLGMIVEKVDSIQSVIKKQSV